jgi:hypothetical protein
LYKMLAVLLTASAKRFQILFRPIASRVATGKHAPVKPAFSENLCSWRLPMGNFMGQFGEQQTAPSPFAPRIPE